MSEHELGQTMAGMLYNCRCNGQADTTINTTAKTPSNTRLTLPDKANTAKHRQTTAKHRQTSSGTTSATTNQHRQTPSNNRHPQSNTAKQKPSTVTRQPNNSKTANNRQTWGQTPSKTVQRKATNSQATAKHSQHSQHTVKQKRIGIGHTASLFSRKAKPIEDADNNHQLFTRIFDN